MHTLRIAAFPFDVRPGEVAQNLAQACLGLEQAQAAGAKLLVLPEKWTTSFLEEFPAVLRRQSEEALTTLHRQAEKAEMMVVGSAPGGEGARPSNELHFLGVAGNLRPYRKRMLFSPTGEARQVERGTTLPSVVSTPWGKICAVICYDLRFPELCRPALFQHADLLLCCAQWPYPRVESFELMSRARAAENQVWLVSCNRAGAASLGSRNQVMEFPGMALCVDPSGKIRAREDGGQLLVSTVDFAEAEALRKSLPLGRDLQRAGLWPQ